MKFEIGIYDKIIFDRIFSFRLKDRFDIISILLNIIFLILNSYDSNKKEKLWNIIIYVNKMSRVFLFSDDKKFSISFPFRFNIDDRKIFSKKWYEIGHRKLSFLKSIFTEEINELEDIIDKLWSNENWCDSVELNELKDVVYDLLFFEDWYIRYDIDKENEAWELHPLYHFDIFYASNNQFKIWLKSNISEDEFIDFLDVTTNCKFII